MLVIIDLETTSADPGEAHILEIGAVAWSGETFSSLCNPGFSTQGALSDYQKALDINGITPEEILSAPLAEAVQEAFRKWLRGQSGGGPLIILGGWNSSRYDSVILDRVGWIPRRYWGIDVMTLAQEIMGNRGALPRSKYGDWKWPRLSEGMDFFEVLPRGELHRALTDAIATKEILERVLGIREAS